MDHTSLTPQEVNSLRNFIDWMWWLGGGTLAAYSVAIWKGAKFHGRILKVETRAAISITVPEHEMLAKLCVLENAAKNDEKVQAVQIRLTNEVSSLRGDISEVKESNSKILGILEGRGI